MCVVLVLAGCHFSVSGVPVDAAVEPIDLAASVPTDGDISLDLRTLRKDVMSAVATAALTGVALPLSAGTLASLSAAVAHGHGEEDLAALPKFFREFMGQKFD